MATAQRIPDLLSPEFAADPYPPTGWCASRPR
jgi:hypothetical protein